MGDNFEACFAETERWEGWHQFSNNPHDPGGATYSGVTQRAYDAYRKIKGLPSQSVRAMFDNECRDIYRTQYWTPCQAQLLPAGLDLCQYDEAVNSGVVEAGRLLQQALGVNIDGMVGLETLNAVHQCHDIPDLIRRVCAARLSFWHRLKTWVYFGTGWNSRDIGIQAAALEMFSASQKQG